MKTTWVVTMFTLMALFVNAANAANKPLQTANAADSDERESITKAALKKERMRIKPLLVQEQNEIDAISNNKKESESTKREAIKKIRKDYLGKRNEIRLQVRYELRAKLLHDRGPIVTEKSK